MPASAYRVRRDPERDLHKPGSLATIIRQARLDVLRGSRSWSILMTVTVYGIPNCGTVKKARSWLEARDIAYTFHDYKKAGITPEKVEGWCREAGWETVLNRAGTTFKKLPDASKSGLDRGKAVRLMCAQPSMIKRPIVEGRARLLVGFNEAGWEGEFGRG
jgi:arsenate reductase